jgi:AcrR family transcriptional regulator
VRKKAKDRRVQRTRALLLDALLDVVAEKGYEAVTVQDITERANVGRSTFYTHFLDKRELLLMGVGGLLTFLVQQGPAVAPADESHSRLLGFSLPLFHHIQHNFRFCRALISPQNGGFMEPQIRQLVIDLIRADFATRIPDDAKLAVPLDVIGQYTVSGFLGLLTWWVAQQLPCSAEEVDRRFRILTIPGLAAALDLSSAA